MHVIVELFLAAALLLVAFGWHRSRKRLVALNGSSVVREHLLAQRLNEALELYKKSARELGILHGYLCPTFAKFLAVNDNVPVATAIAVIESCLQQLVANGPKVPEPPPSKFVELPAIGDVLEFPGSLSDQECIEVATAAQTRALKMADLFGLDVAQVKEACQ